VERNGNGQVTLRSVLDALENRYPALGGTIRDHVTHERRPFVRFFACEEDLSHDSPDNPLPAAVASGAEPLLIVGAIAGGSGPIVKCLNSNPARQSGDHVTKSPPSRAGFDCARWKRHE
jgi:hypothetical protein